MWDEAIDDLKEFDELATKIILGGLPVEVFRPAENKNVVTDENLGFIGRKSMVGTLYLYARSSSSGPRDAFIITDCISIDMLSEDLTEDLYFAKGSNSITFKSNKNGVYDQFLYVEELEEFFIELTGGDENSDLEDRPAKKQCLDEQLATGSSSGLSEGIPA